METKDKDKKLNKTTISKSKYELTLAEFPLFLLSKKGIKDIKFIEYHDNITGKDGKLIQRRWRVYPDGELGFGTSSTSLTFFDLFQIWRQANFESQFIRFGSIYNLLKYRAKKIGSEQYDQITKDLQCLVGMRISAKNAFWDNEKKAYVDMNFHLFDELYEYKEKPTGQATLPFACIKASDVLYGSVMKNSILIANFDRKFFHSLKPTEQRLALYLSKIFRSQTLNKRELVELASQLPIKVREVKYIKRHLKQTCNGLIEKGFELLSDFYFEKGADKKQYIIFKRGGQLSLPFRKPKQTQSQYPKDPAEVACLVEDMLEVCQDTKSLAFYKKVAQLMPSQDIYQALSEVKQARNLGQIKKSKGAFFTAIIKQYAQERGIDL